MRILLDECVDWRLARDLPDYEVSTTAQLGWSSLKNGALLTVAAERFDVFVTVDRNLPYQQNVSALQLAVVVLRARSNRLKELRLLVPELLKLLPGLLPGTVTTVGS